MGGETGKETFWDMCGGGETRMEHEEEDEQA